MLTFGRFLLTTTLTLCVNGGAFAQTPYTYEYGPLAPNPPPGWIAEGRSVQEWDWLRYDYSGTRGRMGLGADPARPEGPGNFSTPGR
ncbi:MAG: hypothetical protein L0Y50_04870 [Beijerinckiaceae bacterium]|nr:hypothetical protein [Beijerinckiaceae bacterium]MCI0735592.1 hypothetical protein [Beijerinckiaceae bacterium]